MSIESIFALLVCFGMYRLGAYNEKHPGEAWRATQLAWTWMSRSWKS